MLESATSRDWLYDQIEPEEPTAYRDTSVKLLGVLNRTIIYIVDNNCNPVAVWSAAFALGLDFAIAKSQSEIARGLDVTRAELSRQVKQFQRMHSLPPTTAQKSMAAVAAYHRTRSSQVA